MAFADPISISVGQTNTLSGGTAKSLARKSSLGQTSQYTTSDGLFTAQISHKQGTRVRSEARLDFFTVYTDPTTGLGRNVSATAYVTLNRPQAGFTSSQLTDLLTGICGYMSQTANMTKFLAGEN
jgi:hypothetical protein